ncbi:TIGR02466 family protein [Pectobacteriaceae bacterium CE90]|nr:TIGR02466 family protein [Pectobacteriaceae bacterium CE90]
MAIDAWFPLAIYYEDLPEHGQYKAVYIERIKQLRAGSGEKRTAETASWTGDVHKVDGIHNDPVFAWLTQQIERHVLLYLKTLGHDLDKIELYIQRSWPVIANKGQWVSRHAHHNANLSAVYYVSIPKEGDAGQTRFFNDKKSNELSNGIDSNMTEGYSEYNAFNYTHVNYYPTEGRLLLFPAKQPHDVLANQTDEERISISYDIIITARQNMGQATPEFLMPSPENWKKFDSRFRNTLLADPRIDVDETPSPV